MEVMTISIIVSVGLILLGLILFAVFRKQKTRVNVVHSKLLKKQRVPEEENHQDEGLPDDAIPFELNDSEPEYNATQSAVTDLEVLRRVKRIKKKSDYTLKNNDVPYSGGSNLISIIVLIIGIGVVAMVGVMVFDNLTSAVCDTNNDTNSTTNNLSDICTTNGLMGGIIRLPFLLPILMGIVLFTTLRSVFNERL